MKKRWIAITTIGVALIVGVRMLPLTEWSTAFVEWARGTGVWGPVVVALAYIPATVLFIPGSILTIGAGYAFGVVIGTIAVSIGSVAATSVAFLLGRTVFRKRVEHKIAGSPKWAALDKAVEQDGFKIVLLMRLSPAFPYNLMGYVFGVTNVRFRDHFFASWIGMFPGTMMFVYLGCAAHDLQQIAAGDMGGRSTAQWILFGVGLLATIAVTLLVTRIARRAIRDAAPEIAEAADEPDTSPSLAPESA